MDISIILPTYNERDNIGRLIDRTLATLEAYQLEILVVDDNSPDGTWQVVAEKAETNPQIRLIHRTDESGLTSAIWRGIKEAQGRWVGWMDCDLSMPPEIWPQLAMALERGADMVVGSRYVSGGADIAHSRIGRTFSRIINIASGLMLDWDIKDYTSGFILARREIFDHIELRGDYGEYCIDMLYRVKQAQYLVQEVPYVCVPRQAGESKTASNAWGYMSRGVNYVKTISRLRFGY